MRAAHICPDAPPGLVRAVVVGDHARRAQARLLVGPGKKVWSAPTNQGAKSPSEGLNPGATSRQGLGPSLQSELLKTGHAESRPVGYIYIYIYIIYVYICVCMYVCIYIYIYITHPLRRGRVGRAALHSHGAGRPGTRGGPGISSYLAV